MDILRFLPLISKLARYQKGPETKGKINPSSREDIVDCMVVHPYVVLESGKTIIAETYWTQRTQCIKNYELNDRNLSKEVNIYCLMQHETTRFQNNYTKISHHVSRTTIKNLHSLQYETLPSPSIFPRPVNKRLSFFSAFGVFFDT